MDLYMHLYMACLFGTAVSGAVTVFLFVRLDIRMALRVLGKRGNRKRTKAVKQSRKKGLTESYGAGAEQKTVLLNPECGEFHVIREILLVHTDEMI